MASKAPPILPDQRSTPGEKPQVQGDQSVKPGDADVNAREQRRQGISGRTRTTRATSRTADMPDKHPNTRRWGGPGSSHEARTEPERERGEHRAAGEPTNTPYSHVSGGGGERDRHHGHDPRDKRDVEENSRQRSKP